mmetsp:Transcript_4262/g.12119  ORF Transcript_4262/g.12119 Transcript_4262/m.12119 type:complete len:206 (+) Transcript_4262:1692-2309(+)
MPGERRSCPQHIRWRCCPRPAPRAQPQNARPVAATSHTSGIRPDLLIPSNIGIHVPQSDEEVRVRALYPRLVVQMANVKLPTRRVRELLVVLLQDLMESHVVEIDILFQLEELVPDVPGLLQELLLELGLVGAILRPCLVQPSRVDPLLQVVETRPQRLHLRTRETANLVDFVLQLSEKHLLRRVPQVFAPEHRQRRGPWAVHVE